MFYKKGWHPTLSWISLPAGIILIALGLIPLLNSLGILAFGLPGLLTTLLGSFVPFIISAIAIFLIIEAFLEDFPHPLSVTTAIVGLLVLVIGVLVILSTFGVIGFTIPFLTMTVYNVIFIILGIFATIAAFAMY